VNFCHNANVFSEICSDESSTSLNTRKATKDSGNLTFIIECKQLFQILTLGYKIPGKSKGSFHPKSRPPCAIEQG
jgi:hypothetical protein